MIEKKGGEGGLPFAGHQLVARPCLIWDREKPLACVEAEAQRGTGNH